MSNPTFAHDLFVLADDPENIDIMFKYSCLEGKFNVPQIAYSVPELIKLADQKIPDVLLVDYFFRDEPALGELNKLLDHFKNTPIVLLSNFPKLLEETIRFQKSKGLVSICQQPGSLEDYKIVYNELIMAYEQAYRLKATG